MEYRHHPNTHAHTQPHTTQGSGAVKRIWQKEEKSSQIMYKKNRGEERKN